MTLQALISKLIGLEMDLGARNVNDGQRLIRDERMRLQYCHIRPEQGETPDEFIERKYQRIAGYMAEASRVAEMWEGV